MNDNLTMKVRPFTRAAPRSLPSNSESLVTPPRPLPGLKVEFIAPKGDEATHQTVNAPPLLHQEHLSPPMALLLLLLLTFMLSNHLFTFMNINIINFLFVVSSSSSPCYYGCNSSISHFLLLILSFSLTSLSSFSSCCSFSST